MKTSTERQIELEQEMHNLGVTRYRNNLQKNREKGRLAAMPTMQKLMRGVIADFSFHIQAYLNTRQRGKARLDIYDVMEAVGSDACAYTTLETIFNTLDIVQTEKVLASRIARAIEARSLVPKLLELMSARELKHVKKRLNCYNDGALRAHIKAVFKDKGYVHPWLSTPRIFHMGTILVLLAVESTGLFENSYSVIRTRSRREPFRTRKHLILTRETQEWIKASDDWRESLSPCYMPSLKKPTKWTNAKDGGYMTTNLLRPLLFKVWDHDVIEEMSGHVKPPVLRAVNGLQETAWTVNEYVAETHSLFWDQNLELGGMPNHYDREFPPEPAEDATEHQKRWWKFRCYEIKMQNLTSQSHRLRTARLVALANKFRGEKLFMPYNLDFRGRAYPIPATLQPQGDKQAKGILCFHEAKPIATKEGERWFLIHGANTFGADKVSFDERVKWAEDNQGWIADCFEDPVRNRQWAEADSPWEFLAWCLEYGDYLNDGLAHESRIPVGMDGSNNGLQIYSLLLRDPKAARETNCDVATASDPPKDIYADVAKRATEILYNSTTIDQEVIDYWKDYLDGRDLPRQATKRAVMTRPYSVTKYRAQDYIYEWFQEDRFKREGPDYRPMPMHGKACRTLANCVWQALDETIPLAIGCMDWFKECCRILIQTNKHIYWDTKPGMRVVQKRDKFTPMTVGFRHGGKHHFVKWQKSEDEVDNKAMYLAIAPNIIHSMDAAAMMMTVNRCVKRGLNAFHMVHDCFGVHACDAPVLAEELREAYIDLFTPNVLQGLHKQFEEQSPYAIPDPPALGQFDVTSLRNATYFFS